MCLRREEEGDVEKVNLPTFFLALENINTVRKCLMKFDVDDNMTAAISSTENEVYRVQQKAKKQQLTLMDMRKKDLDYIINAIH
jgi:hypothetical protein